MRTLPRTFTLTLTMILAVAHLATAGPSQPETVTFWNDVAIRAVSAGRPGPIGFLDVALVQAAVHDAVQAYERRFEPYYRRMTGASGSPIAAAAAAAHGVLAGLYPAQRASLDTDYTAFLAAHELIGDPGAALGQRAAAGLLTQYRAAPTPPLPPFEGGTEPGAWRPTPSYIGDPPSPAPYSPMAMPFLAFTKPYTLLGPAQFRPAPPPALRSRRYWRDYEEVKALGARYDSARTPEQTDLAYFYTDNVVQQWNRVLREVADTYVEQLGDRARLLALANLAAADVLIASWDSKYHYNFWRPITAIHEGEADGNPFTSGDPTWQPLVNTPNYPDYASGANGVAAAVTTTLRHFFGTDVLKFTVTSNAPSAVQRTRLYRRLSDAQRDVVEARLLLGIHFRFADEAARRQGVRVAAWTFRQALRPVWRHK